MIDAILNDRKKILPCSAYLEGEYGISGLFVGVPVKLGAKGIEQVVFNRGGYLYHGRVKALTDAARAAGLNKHEATAEPEPEQEAAPKSEKAPKEEKKRSKSKE